MVNITCLKKTHTKKKKNAAASEKSAFHIVKINNTTFFMKKGPIAKRSFPFLLIWLIFEAN